MDRFTRNALIGSGLLLILLIISLVPWNRVGLTPRIWQLNAVLEQDPMLASYPYPFRALLLANGILTLTRPYDASVPVTVFLAAIDPGLAEKPAQAPEVRAAEEQLRRHEMHAILLMLAEPDVDSVIWSLDRAWLRARGVPLPPAVAAR